MTLVLLANLRVKNPDGRMNIIGGLHEVAVPGFIIGLARFHLYYSQVIIKIFH
jgi:hypothetical protein